MSNKIYSNCPETVIASALDRARDRDLNQYLDDTRVGCIWCGDGLADHSDNLDWIEFVQFGNDYYHPSCFDRYIENQEDKIIKFLLSESEAGAKISSTRD